MGWKGITDAVVSGLINLRGQIVTAFDLWFPKQADQRVLWPSRVRLSEEYFQSLGQHACKYFSEVQKIMLQKHYLLPLTAWHFDVFARKRDRAAQQR